MGRGKKKARVSNDWRGMCVVHMLSCIASAQSLLEGVVSALLVMVLMVLLPVLLTCRHRGSEEKRRTPGTTCNIL